MKRQVQNRCARSCLREGAEFENGTIFTRRKAKRKRGNLFGIYGKHIGINPEGIGLWARKGPKRQEAST